MKRIRAKKRLGQHFLNDRETAHRIAEALRECANDQTILEIGPGMGMLTTELMQQDRTSLQVIEIDQDAVAYLHRTLPRLRGRIIHGDFLTHDLHRMGNPELAIIGNFPYNISSQILFKVLDNTPKVNLLVGMFQKEVAERLVSPPGNKKYGILSVLLQAYYRMEYLFTVEPGFFTPPPKVDSAVIRMVRYRSALPNCDEQLFRKVVKCGFNHRRKTLRNALKPTYANVTREADRFLVKRAEQLSVDDFIALTNMLDKS